jgi:hypothetical protein
MPIILITQEVEAEESQVPGQPQQSWETLSQKQNIKQGWGHGLSVKGLTSMEETLDSISSSTQNIYL